MAVHGAVDLVELLQRDEQNGKDMLGLLPA
jgi:hypothetical protein